MITLDLTKEETFMLRDLATGADCGYEWMQEIADALEEKLEEAIKKPQMKRSEFNRQISDTKTRWENKGLATSMMLAKEAELKFYYDIVEDDDENTGRTGRLGPGCYNGWLYRICSEGYDSIC